MSRTIWEARAERRTEEDRLVERFSRRETPEARVRRIRATRVDPVAVAALRRLWAA